MDQGTAGAISALTTMGLPGLVILGLTYAVLKVHKLYVDAQEARITEGLKCIQTMSGHADILERAASVLERTAKVIAQ